MIRFENKNLLSCFDGQARVKKILDGNSVVWQSRRNVLVYNGGSSLESGFVRTASDGEIRFNSVSGVVQDIYYSDYSQTYSYIENGMIKSAIEVEDYYWYLGCFSIRMDLTQYSTITLVVGAAAPTTVGSVTQYPLAQVLSDYDSTDRTSGTHLLEGTITLDVSYYRGFYYLRLLGGCGVSKIELS